MNMRRRSRSVLSSHCEGEGEKRGEIKRGNEKQGKQEEERREGRRGEGGGKEGGGKEGKEGISIINLTNLL